VPSEKPATRWFNHRLWVGSFFVLALLAVNAGISTRAIRKIASQGQWVAHTQQVLAAAEHTGNLIADAETGQRGYLLTGDQSYLDPYFRAAKEIPVQLSSILSLTADNPSQQERLHKLQSLISAKMALLQKAISAQQESHSDAARQVLRAGNGRQLMEQIRSTLDDVIGEENRLLQMREKSASLSVRDEAISLLVATIIAVFLVVVVARMVDSGIALQQKAAAEIQVQERWLRTTLMSIGDAVIATDARGIVNFINPTAEKLTRLSTQEAHGKHVDEVFTVFNEYTGEPVSNPVAKVIASGEIVGLANHTVLRRLDGTEVPIDDSAAPIKDSSGKLSGVVLVFRDISERRQAEQALRASDRLAVAGRFAATIAHEINNPLEAVTNLIYLATRAESLNQMKEYIEMTEREVSRVSQITRQTLGFYRDSSAPQPCLLSDILDDVLELHHERIRQLSVEVEKDYATKGDLVANPNELRQVFTNLVTNAVQSSSENGKLTVRIKPASNNSHNGFSVEIEDRGAGIPVANREKIFQPFYSTKADTGTGLGLWVSKEIVERHGGEIRFVSNVGTQKHGTCFSVFLPAN